MLFIIFTLSLPSGSETLTGAKAALTEKFLPHSLSFHGKLSVQDSFFILPVVFISPTFRMTSFAKLTCAWRKEEEMLWLTRPREV